MANVSTERRCRLRIGRLGICLAAILGAISWPAAAAWAHPFHVTIAEAEWNQQTKRLEVSLRVHPPDLDRALDAVQWSPSSLPRTATGPRTATDNVERLLSYLRSTLVFRYPNGRPQRLRWVGKEETLKESWLFFEVDLPDGLKKLEVTNRVLCDIEKRQVNTVNFTVGVSRKTLSFTAERPTHRLNFP